MRDAEKIKIRKISKEYYFNHGFLFFQDINDLYHESMNQFEIFIASIFLYERTYLLFNWYNLMFQQFHQGAFCKI